MCVKALIYLLAFSYNNKEHRRELKKNKKIEDNTEE